MSGYYDEWYENFVETIGELGDDELFSAYRSMLSSSHNSFALNRKVMEKAIDVSWVEAIEKGLVFVDNVMRNPRKTIEDVEEVVPIALSRKITVESIKHLAQHTDYIQSIDPKTGKITPSKILNVHKEESLLTYENKFVNTLIDRLYIFVNRRYEKLKAVTHDEEVYALEYTSEVETDSGRKMNMTLKIETVDSLEKTNESGSTVWERVEKIREIIESYKASAFCQEMGQAYIRPPVMRTNAIMKNVDLKACLTLWQFIEGYDKIGYEINISDTAQKPNDTYIQDLYSLTALNYLLFRSFTAEQGENLTELKTKKNRALAPKILRKFNKDNPESYDMSVDGAEGKVSTKGNFSFARKLPTDAGDILKEIYKIIEIEKAYITEEEHKRLEAQRIAEEKERKRILEEQRRIEQERLARAQKEEEERREKERVEAEKLAAERAEKERVRREEEERFAAERAEQERIQEEERLEWERIENERQAKLDEEERIRKAKLDAERKAREQRDSERADKLKAMRTEVEKTSFEEIYEEYSKNPVHVVKRSVRRAVSLIRKDGKVLREGDTNEPILAQKIALEAQLRRQAERDKEIQQEMDRLYERYIPNFLQRRQQKIQMRKRNKNKVYTMPKVMPPERSPEEQRAIDNEIHALFKTYHVSLFEKIKREVQEIKRKVKLLK